MKGVSAMAFIDKFDSICEKASEAAQVAAKKTKKLAEIAKINVSIYSEEDKIKKAQLELGKLYYRDYVVGDEMDQAEYLPWCKRIDESKQTIADLRDYVEELKAEQVQMDETDVPAVVPTEIVTDEDFIDAETVEAGEDDDEMEIEIVVVDQEGHEKPAEPEEEPESPAE